MEGDFRDDVVVDPELEDVFTEPGEGGIRHHEYNRDAWMFAREGCVWCGHLQFCGERRQDGIPILIDNAEENSVGPDI